MIGRTKNMFSKNNNSAMQPLHVRAVSKYLREGLRTLHRMGSSAVKTPCEDGFTVWNFFFERPVWNFLGAHTHTMQW